jgi:hypothetical protein
VNKVWKNGVLVAGKADSQHANYTLSS